MPRLQTFSYGFTVNGPTGTSPALDHPTLVPSIASLSR